MENIKQLYLIGMMGSGKSSTGKALSSSLGWEFIDIDNEISNTHNLTINELFSKGEQYFRDIEYTELRKHILKENIKMGELTKIHDQISNDLINSKKLKVGFEVLNNQRKRIVITKA